MATPTHDQNGLVFQNRRVSRAYDQPVVQHTNKGMVVHQDLDSSKPDPSGGSIVGNRFEALGGMLAKGALGSLTVAGAMVSVTGKASLEFASQLFGFMLLLVLTFVVCAGTFYWWGGTSRGQVNLTVKKVLSIYFLCVSSDVLARLISVFTAIPSTSHIPADTSYFISLAALLLFIISLLVHKEGLNAMFSRESIFFVVCTIVLNFSSTCLFQDVLPRFILPQMVYVGALLGLSVSLAGYHFPRISPSGIYWMFNQNSPARPIVPGVSMDTSLPQSRRDSVSSAVSTKGRASRASFSSLSSMNSMMPQVCYVLMGLYITMFIGKVRRDNFEGYEFFVLPITQHFLTLHSTPPSTFLPLIIHP